MEFAPQQILRQEPDIEAIKVFLKAIEIAGGPQKLVQHRHLTWVPSLLAAAYAVVLKNQYNKMDSEIASMLGLSSNTIKMILKSDPEGVLKKLNDQVESEEEKAHVAGGLAKLAYKAIQQGENIEILQKLISTHNL